jgi:hypothetical protein
LAALSAALKSMKVGDSFVFDADQRNRVSALGQRLRRQKVITGYCIRKVDKKATKYRIWITEN